MNRSNIKFVTSTLNLNIFKKCICIHVLQKYIRSSNYVAGSATEKP